MLKKKFLVIVVLTLAVLGCAPAKVAINSNVASGYSGSSKNIYFVSYVSISQREFDLLLGKSIEDKFSTNGISASYEKSNGLDLDVDAPFKRALANHASLIAFIKPNGGEKTGFQLMTLGRYVLEVYDMNLKKSVYKAAITTIPRLDFWMGSTWDKSTADLFASDVYQSFKDNKLM